MSAWFVTSDRCKRMSEEIKEIKRKQEALSAEVSESPQDGIISVKSLANITEQLGVLVRMRFLARMFRVKTRKELKYLKKPQSF